MFKSLIPAALCSLLLWGSGLRAGADTIVTRATGNGMTINVNMEEMKRDRQKADALYDKGKYAEALIIYQRLAQAGHVEAAYMTGLMYHRGRGAEVNGKEAAKWYEFAAQEGNARAQGNLGVLYRDGIGVEKNLATAAQWLEKSARQGNASAQVSLGALYSNGEWKEPDVIEGVAWMQLAADQRDPIALENMENNNRRLTPEQKRLVAKRAAELKRNEDGMVSDTFQDLMPSAGSRRVEATKPTDPAQAKHDLRLRLRPGQSWSFEQVMEARQKSSMTAEDQQPFQLEQQTRSVRKGTVTVLEVTGGVPSSVRVVFDSACANRMTQMGNEQTVPYPFAGMSVTLRRDAEGQVTEQFSPELQTEIDPMARAELRSYLDSNEGRPPNPVAVGEQWGPDPKQLAQMFQLTGEEKATSTSKLAAITTLDGQRAAEISMHTSVTEHQGEMIMNNEMNGSLWVELETGRLLRSNTKGASTFKGIQSMQSPTGGQMRVKVDNSGDSEMRVTTGPASPSSVPERSAVAPSQSLWSSPSPQEMAAFQSRESPVEARALPPMKTYVFPDGTGSIQLPDGWRTPSQSCLQGVYIEGPSGQIITIGNCQSVLLPGSKTAQIHAWLAQRGTLPPSAADTPQAPFTDPAEAIQLLEPQISLISQRHGGPAIVYNETLEQAKPLEAANPNAKAASVYFVVTRTSGGVATRYRSLARVETFPANEEMWMLATSELAAPEVSFAQDLPVMSAIRNSFRRNETVMQQQRNLAVQGMQAGFIASQRANATRQQDFDNLYQSLQNNSRMLDQAGRNWAQGYRGVGTIEHTATGQQIDVNLPDQETTLDTLNQFNPGAYRPVSP